MQTPKTMPAWRPAARRLSARQPSVFGVSRWMTKLMTSQRGNTTQEFGWLNCSRQMNKAMNTENANPSIRLKIRSVFLGNIRGSTRRETIVTITPACNIRWHGGGRGCAQDRPQRAADDDAKTQSGDPGRRGRPAEHGAQDRARSPCNDTEFYAPTLPLPGLT